MEHKDEVTEHKKHLVALHEHVLRRVVSYLEPFDAANLAKCDPRFDALIYRPVWYDWGKKLKLMIAYDSPPQISFPFLKKISGLVTHVSLNLSSYCEKDIEGAYQRIIKKEIRVDSADGAKLLRRLPVFPNATHLKLDISFTVNLNMNRANMARVFAAFPAVESLSLNAQTRDVPFSSPPLGDQFVEIRARWPGLKAIELRGVNTAHLLRDQLPHIENLVELKFGQRATVIHDRFTLISQCTGLRSLEILDVFPCGHPLDPDPPEHTSWIRSLSSLKVLKLMHYNSGSGIPGPLLHALSTSGCLTHVHLQLRISSEAEMQSVDGFTNSDTFRLTHARLNIVIAEPLSFSKGWRQFVQTNPGLEVAAFDICYTRISSRDNNGEVISNEEFVRNLVAKDSVTLTGLMGLQSLKALSVEIFLANFPSPASPLNICISGEFLDAYEPPANCKSSVRLMFQFVGPVFSISADRVDWFFERTGCRYVGVGTIFGRKEKSEKEPKKQMRRWKNNQVIPNSSRPCCFSGLF